MVQNGRHLAHACQKRQPNNTYIYNSMDIICRKLLPEISGLSIAHFGRGERSRHYWRFSSLITISNLHLLCIRVQSKQKAYDWPNQVPASAPMEAKVVPWSASVCPAYGVWCVTWVDPLLPIAWTDIFSYVIYFSLLLLRLCFICLRMCVSFRKLCHRLAIIACIPQTFNPLLHSIYTLLFYASLKRKTERDREEGRGGQGMTGGHHCGRALSANLKPSARDEWRTFN